VALTPELRRALPVTGAVLSGLLLAASFHPLAWQDAAWIALIPLMAACRCSGPRAGWRLGFVCGAVFWLFSIHWLTHVTVVGWILLALYCALYFAPLGGLFSWWFQRWGVSSLWTNLPLLLAAPMVAVACEYVRAHLFTGFAWNTLGVTQYRNLAVSQLAAWGGVYAVSALVVLLNTSLGLTLLQYIDARGRRARRPHLELLCGLLALALAFLYGWRGFQRAEPTGPQLQVAMIQPAIPQDEKWDDDKVDLIYGRLRRWTHAALRAREVDLVVWPETAVPDDVRTSWPSYSLVYEVVTNGLPLLMGSMDTSWRDDRKPVYYNSSFLFDETGAIAQVYDKRHLVMFGEYVPLESVLPFVKAMTPIQASFSSGSTSTVFRLEKPSVSFSALICFEDTVAHLARASVRNGARLLVNQTNDAWFDASSASRQHMAHCVFRSIENRVPAVRAGNTGVTCSIDAHGRVYDVLEDENGNTIFPGFVVSTVHVAREAHTPTFYTRHGDVFALACLGATVALCGFLLVASRLGRRAAPAPARA